MRSPRPPLTFQSTHPLRGATNRMVCVGHGVGISIHAPLAGCDERRALQPSRKRISIHAPLAGCDTAYEQAHEAKYGISIHAPLAGCDIYLYPLSATIRISIHAPLAGCDVELAGRITLQLNFNPRTPCGVRLQIGLGVGGQHDFNPRTPCGVRPAWAVQLPCPAQISIHAPLAGCDSAAVCHAGQAAEFQSTHPLRGATLPVQQRLAAYGFQSTHPLRGATPRQIAEGIVQRISIHAPLAGCDRSFFRTTSLYVSFQSTHPLRGATGSYVGTGGGSGISIHAPLAGCDLSPLTVSLVVFISIHAPLAGCD